MTTLSRSFGSRNPNHPHLVVVGKGGVEGEVADLRRDTEAAFLALEADVTMRKPVKLATAAPLNACTAAGANAGKTLTQNVAAIENIDGIAVVLGDRVLVKNQVAGKDNGIYIVTRVGTVAVTQVLTRAVDFNSDEEVKDTVLIPVEQGVANANSIWMLTTNNPIDLDVTALVFAQFGTIATHAVDHIRGGSDEVDGDVLDIDWNPTNYVPTIVAPATHIDELTSHLNGIDLELADEAQSKGSVAIVILKQVGQPDSNDTLVVGGDTYEIDGVGGNINVAKGGDAAATLDNLLAEAIAHGTASLLWDKLDATHLRLRSAAAPNGAVAAADPAIGIDASNLTNWSADSGNVNMNTLAGKAVGQQSFCATKLALNAGHAAEGSVRVAFTFAPSVIHVTAFTAAGAVKATAAATFVVSGNEIIITLNGALVATDVLHITAYA